MLPAASVTLVTPNVRPSAIAALSARRWSAGLGLGSTLLMSAIAGASLINPVGSPVFGSRTMVPFGGSGVFFVMPAAASAFELTHTLCSS